MKKIIVLSVIGILVASSVIASLYILFFYREPATKQPSFTEQVIYEAGVEDDIKGLVIYRSGGFEKENMIFTLADSSTIILAIVNKDTTPVTLTLIEKPQGDELFSTVTLQPEQAQEMRITKTGDYSIKGGDPMNSVITIRVFP